METLIDTLKAMQKVTCTELATSLGIAPAEAIKMLREYEEQGEVVSVNGYWSVSERQSGVKEKQCRCVKRKENPAWWSAEKTVSH